MFGGCFLIFFTPTGNVYLRDLCFMTKNYSERGPWDRLSQRLYLNSGRSPCKFAVLQILREKNMHFDVYCMQIIMKIYRFNFLPHCSCPVEIFVSRLFREEKKLPVCLMRLIWQNREKFQFNHNLLMDDLFLDVDVFFRLLMGVFFFPFSNLVLFYFVWEKKEKINVYRWNIFIVDVFFLNV